jgi:hypothetical protein
MEIPFGQKILDESKKLDSLCSKELNEKISDLCNRTYNYLNSQINNS